MTEPNEIPLEVDCQALKQSLDSGEDLFLLDCREEGEYQTAHIAGSTLIPTSQWAARHGELEPHRQRRVVVHCHHGVRSLQVVRWMREQGYNNAQSLTGGIDAWAAKIDPTLPRY